MTAADTTTRRYGDEVHKLYEDFVRFVQDEKDEEATYRPDYEPRYANGKTVPAIVTSLDGVSLGMLWFDHCERNSVHWSDVDRWSPTSWDSMGMDKIYHP